MRRLPFSTLVVLFVVAGRTLAVTSATTTPTEAASAVPTAAGTIAATGPATTAAVAATTVTTAPAMLGVATAAAADSAAVSIVEPPFKPPATWRYEPAVLTVKVGTTVTWTNAGAVIHTATADDGKTFDSGLMRPKATFSFAPKSAGTFAYHCTYHPWMKGTIIAQP